MPAPRSLLELALALIAGTVVGVLGSYAQQYVLGSARVPAGAALGVLLLAAAAVAVHLGLSARLGGAALALGWFVAVTLASSRRREGDVLVPSDTRGWSFLLGGVLVLGVAVALPLWRAPTGAR